MRTHGIPFDLQWFADGEDAVAHIDQLDPAGKVPDVILLDLNLPRLDGKEVLARIRKNRRLEHVPVAVLTSSDSPHDRREAARLGASIYIKKPPTLDEFLDVGSTIKDLLESSFTR